MRKSLIGYALMFYATFTYAQGGVNDPGMYYYTVSDCFLDKHYKPGFKPDTADFENQMKGTRIWRSISLDNPQNKELLNTNLSCTEVGLFEIIKFGLLSKGLNAFNSDNFAMAGSSHLQNNQVLASLKYNDSTVTVSFDANGNETKETMITKRYLMGSDVKSYLLLEDWVINNKSGAMEKYIIGFAPLVFNVKEGKTYPLFWLYYPEWKGLLASFEAKNVYGYSRISFYDVLEKRYFISQISKENNIYNRSIKDIRKGSDIQLESELIKERLINAESNLFEH